jgi:hypothetical protein
MDAATRSVTVSSKWARTPAQTFLRTSCKRHRADRGRRLPRAGYDVGDVLLVHRDVIAGGEPAEVPQMKGARDVR